MTMTAYEPHTDPYAATCVTVGHRSLKAHVRVASDTVVWCEPRTDGPDLRRRAWRHASTRARARRTR